MNDLMVLAAPLIEHVQANPVIYGIGAVVAVIIIYFTRPYSSAVILYSIEISIYLSAMHLLIYVCVYLMAGFSNETTMKGVFGADARGTAPWTTPLVRFWERDVYDPSWIMWFEVVVTIIILLLMRYYRPMQVQTKYKSPETEKMSKPKKKGYDDDSDDGWGVPTTREFTLPKGFEKKMKGK
ncbi:MAG: hypothetical protein KAH38_07320 [Candidatus Hydrogenedentes bacterium]|nr:hypothetical protein [Candidatus Hydrogenedentota bacterium]